ILNAAFYSGSTLLILDHFNPKVFLEIIENYKVEQLFLVPPLINFLINSSLTEHHNLSTVKHIHNSAASLLEEDSKILKAKFNLKALHQLYGLTETTGVVIHTLGNEPYPMGSCGKLVARCQLKIVDVKTREKMGANANGEICIKTSRNMKGYINDTEKTNAAFDSEGFLRTGDIGHYDEEGFIFIVGRIKDLINYKGHKVSPIEIENILLKHPSVKDAAVVGKSDRRAGETAVGFIVKKEGTAVSEQEIFDYLSKFVGVEKRLHGGIHFVDVIPKSVNGKILRKELQKMFE
ncbi:AMP-binding domain containing protein, partial [Asbolus verrucosus]